MDLNGRLVQFGKIWDSARLVINLKNQPGGIYILQAINKSNGRTHTDKIVVQ
ncbi:MAG: hypothetical protein ABR574_10045 [Cryomorphaceae bacterium]